MTTRRRFLQIVGAGIVSFFILAWNKLTLQHLETGAHKTHSYPFNPNKKVSFNDDFIIVSESSSVRVYSAHCTHLGCRIDKMEGDRFVCPCHGSEYDLNGKVVKGPAYRNLTELNSTISEDGNEISIEG